MSTPARDTDPLAQIVSQSSDDSPTNRLPQLISLLRRVGSDERPSIATESDSNRFLSWLDQAAQRGAALTLGIPGSDRGGATWMGHRIAWWPEGIPQGRWVAVASSRLGRSPDQQPAWFSGLRTVASRCHADNEHLVSVVGTAASEFVVRAAELFGTMQLQVQFSRNHHGSLLQWLDKTRQYESDASSAISRAFISPSLDDHLGPSDNHRADPTDLTSYPLADRILLAMSDHVYVLRLRQRSNTLRLLQQWLRSPLRQAGRIHLLVEDTLITPSLRADLMSQGALGWYLLTDQERPYQDDTTSAATVTKSPGSSRKVLAEIPSSLQDPFLIHCTRRRHGPWPDETRSEYLDGLVNSWPTADHSSFAALRRIVTGRRLVATGIGIRGGANVVSFTAVPLTELHRLRVFRPHRGRWDFEPYGIAIRRSWLVERGVQPVRYANAESWAALDAADRPFYQRALSTTTSGRAIDWTVEQEWRHRGDLLFNNLPEEDAFLLVPTQREAEQLATISPWSVLAIELLGE